MSDQPPPPWVKYPEIPRYSIGWRMGDGEEFLLDWWSWSETLDTNERVEYFRQYKPLPVEWLDWISAQFGFDAGDEGFNSAFGFDGIHWLEKQGLADFATFQEWYDAIWSEPSAPTTPPAL